MSLNKLAAPFLILSLAAFGCSSSSGGGAAGAGGGSAGASAGAGGSDAAAGGTTGTDAAAGTTGTDAAAGTTGTDAAAGTTGTDAAADTGADAKADSGADAMSIETGSDADVTLSCTVSTDTAGEVLTAADFCANVVDECTATTAGAAVPTAYATAGCMATYTALSTAAKHCQSYHLCWGVEGKGNGPKLPGTHCAHAWGGGPCAGL
jgi:hypothetical protein